jgi:ABC-type uncharacterized transport system auxiliary subunit
MLGDRAMVISSTHTIGNTLTCDYRLAIDFDDIIYNCATKEVIVKCTWSLFDYDRKQQQLMHRFVGSEHVEEESFDSIVVALKHALWHIAADIAHAVKQLPLDVKDEDMAAFATGDDESPSGQCQQCSN